VVWSYLTHGGDAADHHIRGWLITGHEGGVD
jgi:hypothetical protein